MALRLQLRRGTAAAWTAANPVLADGEIGFETDTGYQKIGDGVTAWIALAYRTRRTTDDLAEGATNLYATPARVLSTVLAGLSTAAGTVVDATHTVLQAIGFLQHQVTARELLSNKSTDIAADAASDAKYPSVKAVKTYADALVVGLLDDRGSFDASGNTFPAAGGSGAAGAILKGDLWYISAPGTLGGTVVAVGASVRALVDNPGQTPANWDVLNVGLGFVPENVANKDTDATLAANSDAKYASQKAVKTYVDAATSRDIHAAASKAAPADADELPLIDSASAFGLKKFTWANLKALFTALTSTAAQESPTLGVELTAAPGWTSAGWTGNYNAGFTHTAGNTTALSFTPALVIGTRYAIAFTISGRTAGQVDIAMGGIDTTGGDGHKFPDAVDGAYPTTAYQIGVLTADGTTPLTFTPTSTFDGTISLISVKVITGPITATTSITNSTGTVIHEVRSLAGSNGSMFSGYQSGQFNLTGGGANTGFGCQALAGNLGGPQNTAFGYRALVTNSAGRSNTAIGVTALGANTTGDQNTAVGVSALISNTTGLNNIAVGVESLKSNTTGSYNVSVGPYDTMYYNVSGSNNVAVGMLALQNHTGSNTTAVGSNALQANTSGAANTGVGFYALNVVQTGGSNTAVGYQAGAALTTSDNTLVGTNAGVRAAGTTGSNTALGSNALAFITTGGYGTGIGAYSLNKATGRGNTGLGTWAGKDITTGRANISIGAFTDVPTPTVDGQINIGCVIFGKGAYDGGGAGATQTTPNAGATAGVGTNAPTSTWHVAGSFARNTPTTVAAGAYGVVLTDAHIIANNAGTVTLTLPAAASFPGRELTVRTIQAQTVISASSNVVPLAGGAAGTAILAGVAGKWAVLVSDGANWQVQMAN